MTTTILRRRRLGGNSSRGLILAALCREHRESMPVTCYNQGDFAILRNDKINTPKGQEILKNTTRLIRWGCTSETVVPLALQVNKTKAIHDTNNKLGFRAMMMDKNPTAIPDTWFSYDEVPADAYPVVVRPCYHAQGKNFHVVYDRHQLWTVMQALHNPYVSRLIEKVAEYRVYVVGGRVATVAEKTPDDPKAHAWNVAQGGRFDVVKWGSWDMGAVRVAVEAMNLTPLDFGGVDVMVDEDGRAYVIEINTAPSLPFLSDGRVSYRQKCMSKALMYTGTTDQATFENWKGCIHPTIKETN